MSAVTTQLPVQQSERLVTFGSVEVSGHMDPRSADKIYVTAPGHAEGSVDVVVTNPDHQTAVAIGAYTFALPDSFDVDGDWTGGAITGHELFSFTVVNRSVVSISCWTSGTVMLSPSAPITDGEFSFSVTAASPSPARSCRRRRRRDSSPPARASTRTGTRSGTRSGPGWLRQVWPTHR